MPGKYKNAIVFLLLIICILILDQVSKNFIMALYEDDPIALYRGIPVIEGFLEIAITFNYGIIFGMLQDTGNKYFLIMNIIILSVVLGFLIRELYKGYGNLIYYIGFGMVIGGALGNIADRFLHGKVIDFIKVYITRDFVWPIFNIADSFITIGIIIIIIDLIFFNKEHRNVSCSL